MNDSALLPLRRAILAEALKEVPFDGWTESMMKKAAVRAGYAAEYALVAFPGDVSELVDFFLQESDQRMLEAAAALDLSTLKVREKIAKIVEIRIRQHAPHKAAVYSLLSYCSLHPALSLRALARTVSKIWYAAGDTSADFNYYTKRFLLAGVYSSTLLYWLEDKSPDYQDSWGFLERRIENVMWIGKAKTAFLKKVAL